MPEFGVYEQTYKELETPYHVHSSRRKNKGPTTMTGQFFRVSRHFVISENSHLCRTRHYSRQDPRKQRGGNEKSSRCIPQVPWTQYFNRLLNLKMRECADLA